jgi:hypothetical protein
MHSAPGLFDTKAIQIFSATPAKRVLPFYTLIIFCTFISALTIAPPRGLRRVSARASSF